MITDLLDKLSEAHELIGGAMAELKAGERGRLAEHMNLAKIAVAVDESQRHWDLSDMQILTKWEKLLHYAGKQVTRFFQVDCFIGQPNDESDAVVKFNQAGHSIFFGTTDELMSGAMGVRVLVTEETSTQRAIEALEGIIQALQRHLDDDDVIRGRIPLPLPGDTSGSDIPF